MYDMTIRLQTNGEKCLYEQIYEHIRQEIREGKLLAGERLPSTRSLAEYLQVARSTVDYAYDQLLSEGYIEARPYRGYFVCPIEELLQLDAFPTQVRGDAGSEDGCRAQQGGMNRSRLQQGKFQQERLPQDKSWQSGENGYRYDFSPNEIDMSGFPFGIWKKISKNILNDGNSELFSQGETQGDYDLRSTIARYLHSSRGVNCVPEQIIVGAGNDYLLLLLEKILGRHVRIAMENPTYKRAYRIFRSFAYDITAVNMDEAGMEVEPLERENISVAYVMPSHQFPTGRLMPIGRRRELLKWADGGADRYLIEDDYDSEFRYKGKPIPSLQASDAHGRVIYMGTFSKAIAPGIRVSYMVLPEKLLDRYQRECSFYSCTVSRIDQRILNEFIRDGYFERHLNKMRKLYRGKHELLLECLQSFEKRFVISGEHSGLHLLLTTRGTDSEEELLQKAAEKGVRVYGLSESIVEATPERATVLLGFGGLTPEEIVEGTRLLREAWEPL